MSEHAMSEDRQNAIRLMLSRGWKHKRNGQKHEFTRPDTGGLYDVKRVSHGNLSLQWAISSCDDEELARRVSAVRNQWVAEALCPAKPRADLCADPALLAEAVEVLREAVAAWELHNKSGDMMQGHWAGDARLFLNKLESRHDR